MIKTTVYKTDDAAHLSGYIHHTVSSTGLASIVWQVCHVPRGVIAHGVAKSHHAAKVNITLVMKHYQVVNT